MKPGKSLNPYAAAYIPFSRRETKDKSNTSETTSDDNKSDGEKRQCKQMTGDKNKGAKTVFEDAKSHGETSHGDSAKTRLPDDDTLEIWIPGIEELLNCEDSSQKGHNIANYGDSAPQNPRAGAKGHNLVEDFGSDVAFLADMFPGISDQSLVDAHFANGCDLDATIEMLIQLECQDDEFQQLPDTLDDNDLSEFSALADDAFMRQNTSAPSGEASSSSGPSDSQ
ncbi:uncharacterized protein LOC143846982 [Tasmannia lanceolata]|uniref:uncharacterized protein LOC143846982 n=1 Tax=Tasmannia lanceolata TaxID=3420 RepID=UPI004063287E